MKKIINGIIYDTDFANKLGASYDADCKETVTLFVDKDKNYFLSYEKGTIIPLMGEHKLYDWVAKNLDAKASERILGIHYSIGVECYIDGEEFFDEYEPLSQKWEDIELCYEEQCLIVSEEESTFEFEYEWLINDFQPASRFEDENGNTIEVYVCYTQS